MFCCCSCCGFCFALSPQILYIEACIECAIAGASASLCAIDFWAARFARLRPSFIQQALRFRQCSLASVGFLLLVGGTSQRGKIHDIKTPSQRIALLEAKLARARRLERKQRTRRLIGRWAMLEPLGERVAALTAEQRKYFISRVLAN
jgi:hypothetical protein